MKEKISKVLNLKGVQYCLVLLMILTALIPLVGALFKSAIDCDSAYYICIAQRITEGYVPYKSIAVGYTPLFLYIMAVFKLIFSIPNGCYWPYLLLYFIFEIGTSYFVYAIAREFGAKKMVALFGAWLNIIISHRFGGDCVLLEIPSLFFGLASSLFILRFKGKNIWNYLWIGCLTSCSFLCKQYGLGFVVLNLYLMITVNRQSWKTCGIFALGCVIPIALCFVCYGSDFLPIMFSGYGTKSGVAADSVESFTDKINVVFSWLFSFCFTICIAVLAGLLCVYKAVRCGHFWKLLFGYCGIVGFSLQFFFAAGLHYWLYMVPFACLVITEMLTIKNVKIIEVIKIVAISWVVFVNLYKVYNNIVYKRYVKNDIRKVQYDLTDEISEYVKPGETLWVVHPGLYFLLFTADVLPPNVSTIGYSFGSLGLNEDEAFQQAENADWIIRFLSDADRLESYFTDSLRSYVEQYPMVAQFDDSTKLLYKVPKE